MATEKKSTSAAKVAAEEKSIEFKVPKDASIDEAVTVISLPGDPYHDDGHEFEMAKKTADILVKRGWVEIKEVKNKESEEK